MVKCKYVPEIEHEYPEDWIFGGADGTHPGADSRYKPATYMYFDKDLVLLSMTNVPTCDEAAIAYVAHIQQSYRCEVSWVQVIRDRNVTTVPETLVSGV